ncbi:MAG: GyrI-like domain-containing protein [Cardiobacteriaceae bacterium]|nr:GyrI-like domain-containing protein [Cardiobacteriaceae bacterium]
METTLYLTQHIETNNFTDAALMDKFTRLWQEGTRHVVAGQPMYAVYHHYHSDYRGDYTCSIATENAPPQAAETLVIPACQWQIYICTADTLVPTWQQIWQDEESGKLSRLYQVDYEKHLSDGRVEIYIGIR